MVTVPVVPAEPRIIGRLNETLPLSVTIEVLFARKMLPVPASKETLMIDGFAAFWGGWTSRALPVAIAIEPAAPENKLIETRSELPLAEMVL